MTKKCTKLLRIQKKSSNFVADLIEGHFMPEKKDRFDDL